MKKSGFIQSLISDIVCNILLFLAAPVMLALYAPEKIGLYASYQAIVGLICVVSTVRLEYTVRGEITGTDPVLSTIMVFGFFASLVSTVLVFCFTFLSDFNGPFTFSGFVFIVAGSYLFGLFNYLSFKVVGIGKPNLLTIARMQRVFIILAIQLAIPYVTGNDDFLFLLTGFVLSLFAAVFYMFYFSGIQVNLRFSELKSLLNTFKVHKSVIIYNTPSAFLFSGQDAIVFLYISKMSLADAGIYFIADRLLRTPIFVLNQTLRQYIISGRFHISRFKVVLAQSCMTCMSFLLFFLFGLVKDEISLPYYYKNLVWIFCVLSIIYGFQIGISVLSSIAIKNHKDGTSMVYTISFFFATIIAVAFHYIFPEASFYLIYVACASLAHLGGFIYIWKHIGAEHEQRMLASPAIAS